MPSHTALRFKSGKGKSIRIDKIRAQKRKEISGKFTRFKTICATLVLFIGSIAFLSSFFIYKNLNQNFASASSYDTYIPEYPTFAYLVVNDFDSKATVLKKLEFIVMDKESNKVFIFELPINIELDLLGKYSSMSLEQIFLLGGLNTENKLEGGVTAINTNLLKIFGFDVTNFIVVEEGISPTLDRLLVEGKEIFPFGGLTPSVMKHSFYTNYELKDFYQTQKFMTNVPFENIVRSNLTSDQISTPVSLDNLLSDMTMPSSISKDKKTISVLNGTSVSGIATLSSRILSNIGGRVVAIENATSKYTDTMLISDDLDSQTVAYIKKSFGINRVYTKQEAGFINEDVLSRSDITLIIGFDLANRLY